MPGYDINIMGDPTDSVTDLVNTNQAVDGIMKLTQRVMILLLTDDSVSTNLEIGTEVPQVVFSGNASPDGELIKGQVDQGLDTVREILLATQNVDTDPADERIDQLSCIVTVDGADEVTVEVIIVAASGESTTVTLPTDNIFNTAS